MTAQGDDRRTPDRNTTVTLDMKTSAALITGITGQDGSYLAEHLLELGYEVHGIVRRAALEDPTHRLGRIFHLLGQIHLHPASLDSYPSIFQVFAHNRFDECYHLAAQSFVAENFNDGFSTMNVNIAGTHYVLAAIRQLQPECRFYFAGSSEMFGKARHAPQNEQTPFHPRSPYGISKVAGFELTRNYRENYGMFCCSGLLFNHESPRRGFEYVSRKVTSAVARIKLGATGEIRLGNLDASRDWGHAKDYVRAMHLMLQQSTPDDFVIATGHCHTVRQLCQIAFAHAGMNYENHVIVDPRFVRPPEAVQLVGDPSKASHQLGWKPQISFEQLIPEMVGHDLAMGQHDKRASAA